MSMAVQMLIIYISRAIVLLLCIPIHEFAHGKAAGMLGDPTAKQLGRLTLNPLKHLDLFGSLSMILIGVGWAKPVPVNPHYFAHPKRDFAITSLAGPLANLFMGFVAFIFYKVFYYIAVLHPTSALLAFFLLFFQYAAFINVMLTVFNLIPIPPLDGSKLVAALLPDHIYAFLMRYEHLGMIIVLGLMVFGFLQVPLDFLTEFVLKFYDKLTFFVDLIMKAVLGITYGQVTV